MHDPSRLQRETSKLCQEFDGEAAFFARNLTTGEEIGYQQDRIMPAASTIKLLVLSELFRQVEAGAFDLDAPVETVPEDQRGGSGILKDLSPSLLLPIRDHATLMIALSDNTSTAVLVRLLGREQIVESGRGWGMQDTSYGFQSSGPGVDPRNYAASTPQDLVTLLTGIATGTILSPDSCRQFEEILLTQQYLEQIGRYLPFSTYSRQESPVKIRSKSGFQMGIRADAGIIDLPDGTRYIIALMTEGSPDLSFGAEHPGSIHNGRISKLIYDEWLVAR